MTTTRSPQELRRSIYLSIIRRSVAESSLTSRSGPIGLAEVAHTLKAHFALPCARDGLDVRQLLLTVAVEWDLSRDALEQQSDECLAALVACFRPNGVHC